MESHWDRSDRYTGKGSCRWYVSAPTIKAETGKFLASDPTGGTPSVSLVGEKGAHTRWVFEFVRQLQPGSAKEERNLREGASGFTFRVKAAEGPFKDWYLAAEEPARETALRLLKLVPDVKRATVFTYIEENYYVDHK